MSLRVSSVCPEDAPTIAAIVVRAFANDRFQKLEYPTKASLRTLHQTQTNDILLSLEDPNQCLRKVVEHINGKIISFAKWTKITPHRPVFSRTRARRSQMRSKIEEEVSQWTGSNATLCEEYFAKSTMKKAELMDCKAYYRKFLCRYDFLQMPNPREDLELLVTDPDHRRRGAAATLVNECIMQAAAEKLPAYLESTPSSVLFYIRTGFIVLDEFTVILKQDADTGLVEQYVTSCMLFNPPRRHLVRRCVDKLARTSLGKKCVVLGKIHSSQ
jgi:GNAT superfamily N-acetyltransferase